MFTDIERHGLLKFVPPNFLSVNVLVIDSPELLDELRKLLPAAQIAFMTTKRTHELEKICNDVRADLLVGNYLHGELPTAPKIFELILAQEILSAGETLYPTLLALNHLLTDSGALLTKFAEPTWTKARIVKLLDDAIYKEIRFLPDENFWLVKARKCTAEVAALKELFTESTRAELSRLLHRIEYDIDVDENFSRLIKLCDREGIFDEYLTDFINQVVVHESAKDFIRARSENFGRVLNFDS
ncbi:MAG: hypothetical protein IJ685_12115 [Selenomonadaceae bacterium]|nr:hypothetical protein [Selenomonadaceae bacterium]